MKVLVDTMKTFTKVNQIEGKCPVPEELAATVVSATLGTALEGRLTSETQMRRCLKRVRSGDNKVESKKGESVCALRNDWLTVPNVDRSLNGWEDFLKEKEYGDWREHPDTGERCFFVPRRKRQRVVQPDETHQVMSTELEHGGSRAYVYCDSKLGAPQRALVSNAKHISAMYAINFAGEILPPHYWFDTEAKEASKQGVSVDWIAGLPKVRGYFGFNHKVSLHPSYSMNTKGGCINDDFLDWIDKSVGEPLLSQYKY